MSFGIFPPSSLFSSRMTAVWIGFSNNFQNYGSEKTSSKIPITGTRYQVFTLLPSVCQHHATCVAHKQTNRRKGTKSSSSAGGARSKNTAAISHESRESWHHCTCFICRSYHQPFACVRKMRPNRGVRTAGRWSRRRRRHHHRRPVCGSITQGVLDLTVSRLSLPAEECGVERSKNKK